MNIKKYINRYSISIAVIMIIIIIAIILIFVYRANNKIIITPSGMKVVDTQIEQDKTISEEEARETAIKQFKILGEDATNADLTVTRIRRNEEDYYYIITKRNTMEVKIKGGKITRINSAPVDS